MISYALKLTTCRHTENTCAQKTNGIAANTSLPLACWSQLWRLLRISGVERTKIAACNRSLCCHQTQQQTHSDRHFNTAAFTITNGCNSHERFTADSTCSALHRLRLPAQYCNYCARGNFRINFVQIMHPAQKYAELLLLRHAIFTSVFRTYIWMALSLLRCSQVI